LGLALDELENNSDYKFKDNDIDIILDEKLKSMIDSGSSFTVDFIESAYGAGFVVNDTSASCGSCSTSGGCC